LRSAYEEQIRQAARREERARLAADLHDAVKQQLFVIQAAAATVQARFDTDAPGARAAIEQVRTATREAMTEMDAMLDQMHASPVENVGLIEALSKQCEALGFRTGAAVTFSHEPLPPATSLGPGAQPAIFRVAQEALANVARHARARQVTVRLGVRKRALVLDVVDDGAGFDPIAQRPAMGMGIRNMQARAAEIGGHFDLASGPGKGTTVSLSVPLTARSARAYLFLSVTFASVLAVATVLLFNDASSFRALWLGLMWIGLIGTARYLVALYRVTKASRQTA
jgi:signal transduction histidine kinase